MPRLDCGIKRVLRATCDNGADGTFTIEELADELVPFLSLPTAIVVDRKSQGVDGGTFTSGAWRTRDLNTILSDPTGLVLNLASNQVTLAPGFYFFTANCPARAVTNHMARIQNLTAGATLEYGQSVQTGSAVSDSIVWGSALLPVQSVIEVQHQSRSNQTTNGFGSASNFVDAPETYTQLIIRRIGDAN